MVHRVHSFIARWTVAISSIILLVLLRSTYDIMADSYCHLYFGCNFWADLVWLENGSILHFPPFIALLRENDIIY